MRAYFHSILSYTDLITIVFNLLCDSGREQYAI